MIDEKSIQRALAAKGLYKGPIDGVVGPQTQAGMRAAVVRATASPDVAKWPGPRVRTAFSQVMMRDAGIDVGKVDGFAGPQFAFGLEKWQDYLRGVEQPDDPPLASRNITWPRQREARAYFGKPGENHAMLALPYPMRIAWNPAQTIERFVINAKCRDSAQRVYMRVLGHYGEQRIRDLGLDLFGGCYNNRKMLGGDAVSMHAYAIAIDHDPERNQLRWGRDRAAFARPVYEAWWRFWEEEGWISLGRERNFDWMHVQAARL
jgi:hypothetical protein